MHFRWFQIALVNLLLAALIGATLRYAFVEELAWLDFRNAMHAHSHGAMLGWVYLALFALFVGLFLRDLPADQERYFNRLFWATEICVVGMFIAFMLSGYSLWAIGLSTLHIILSYVFAYRFWQAGVRKGALRGLSGLFAKTALVFMIISTLGLWAMGPLMALGLQGSAVYYASIQWFLHFQFNGWFLFGAIAIFLRLLKLHRVAAPGRLLILCFRLLVLSTFLTYTLAVTWSTPLDILFYLNSAGVLLQALAAAGFVIFVKYPLRQIRAAFSRRQRRLFSIALWCFLGKVLIQTIIVVPYIATVAYTIRNYVIGFIHLILLGAITHLVLGSASASRIVHFRAIRARIGLRFLFAGFVLSELVLFVQGTMFWCSVGFIPYYYALLFGVSACIPIGIMLILMSMKPHPAV